MARSEDVQIGSTRAQPDSKSSGLIHFLSKLLGIDPAQETTEMRRNCNDDDSE